MNYFPFWLKSLAMAALVSFSAPFALLGIMLLLFAGFSIVPGLTWLSHFAIHQLVDFLHVFGNGDLWQGLMIVGLTSCLVGILFDVFNFFVTKACATSRN